MTRLSAPGELFRVAAHQQNPGTRTQGLEFIRQVAAAHSGKYHICQQQIDWPGVPAAGLECLGGAGGDYQPVAGGLR